MANLDLMAVMLDPEGSASVLAELSCVDSAEVVSASKDKVALTVVFVPDEPAFIAEGYPIEQVRLVVRADGEVWAVPKSKPGRQWKHRNSFGGVPSSLCLWDPNDPLAIRWTWEDGFEEYVRILARHLVFEEYNRRRGEWPVEDSPHGESTAGRWPIRTRDMRRAVRRWVRE